MSALDDAWQGALAAEHQAVFGYSLLGPRLGAADRPLAVASSDAHETLRDATTAALAGAGRTPVSAEADYPALYPVPDAKAARQLAIRLEKDCAAAWRFLYAQTMASESTLRASAQAALTASAVRATGWRLVVDPTRATVAFPGI